MPIYGYICMCCGHHLDALQKMNDAPLTDCPSCGEPDLKRQLSAPKFRLKGKGWYETDFKTGDKRNVHADDKPSGAKSDSATDSADSSSKADPA